MYKRFPRLKCSECVKIVARLRINYGATKSFAEIARNLGFWDYISCNLESRQKKMKPLLEDVFEAFLGVIELIIDEELGITGPGFFIVYKILENIFNNVHISLKYEDLYDAKTRLKELFDAHSEQLGALVYEDTRIQNDLKKDKLATSNVFRIHNPIYYKNPKTGIENKKKILAGQKIFLGKGYASLKPMAQQYAAQMAIKKLEKDGFKKDVDYIYNVLNNIEHLDYNLDVWKDGMNELYPSKYKSKYNFRYKATPIIHYIKENCLFMIQKCLKNNSLLDISDNTGMYPLDYIIIKLKNNKDEIKKYLKIIYDYNANLILPINNTVIKMYLQNEIDIFQNINIKIIVYSDYL